MAFDDESIQVNSIDELHSGMTLSPSSQSSQLSRCGEIKMSWTHIKRIHWR